MRGGRYNNTQNAANEDRETSREDNDELQKTNVNQQVEPDVINERLQKIFHVFDLIDKKLINAKIGKHVAMVIANTGQTAEEVIKTVGLSNGMNDHWEFTKLIVDKNYTQFINLVSTGEAKAKAELIGLCMRQSGGKMNPGLLSHYIDKLVNDFKNGGRDQYDKELKAWETETSISAVTDYENPHFKAIVAMGDKCIPWIHETIKASPHPVVHALDLLMPKLVMYTKPTSLADTCEAWDMLLKMVGYPTTTYVS